MCELHVVDKVTDVHDAKVAQLLSYISLCGICFEQITCTSYQRYQNTPID